MECDYHIILLYQVSQHIICILWIQNTSIFQWLYSDDTHEGQILWRLKCYASQKLKKKNNHCKGIFLKNMTENEKGFDHANVLTLAWKMTDAYNV